MISIATIVEPTGVSVRIDMIIPNTAQTTDSIAEQIVTLKNVLKIRIADSAGKMINAEINNEPTRFIARTMITAIITAITRL